MPPDAPVTTTRFFAGVIGQCCSFRQPDRRKRLIETAYVGAAADSVKGLELSGTAVVNGASGAGGSAGPNRNGFTSLPVSLPHNDSIYPNRASKAFLRRGGVWSSMVP